MNLSGTWTNELGSRLSLEEAEGGALSGSYRSPVGAADAAADYALAGLRSGRCLGFVVAWGPAAESVTAWSGLVEADAAGRPIRLHTMWTLVRAETARREADGAYTAAAAAPWEAFSVQASVFSRTPGGPVPPSSRCFSDDEAVPQG